MDSVNKDSVPGPGPDAIDSDNSYSENEGNVTTFVGNNINNSSNPIYVLSIKSADSHLSAISDQSGLGSSTELAGQSTTPGSKEGGKIQGSQAIGSGKKKGVKKKGGQLNVPPSPSDGGGITSSMNSNQQNQQQQGPGSQNLSVQSDASFNIKKKVTESSRSLESSSSATNLAAEINNKMNVWGVDQGSEHSQGGLSKPSSRNHSLSQFNLNFGDGPNGGPASNEDMKLQFLRMKNLLVEKEKEMKRIKIEAELAKKAAANKNRLLPFRRSESDDEKKPEVSESDDEKKPLN